MDAPLHLGFLWHMHQPAYRDPLDGHLALPWVRLHATRGYFDMAWMLERHPSIRATINLVPVLVEQIASYVERGERDRYWDLSIKPARLLTHTERGFIARHFFSCHVDTCIRPRPRYWTLYNRRGPHGSERTVELSDGEVRDLQVLFNLAWFGFAARNEYPLLAELEQKGRGYTEDEKRKVLDLQIAVMRRLMPLYQRLQARGQIELTATPYYHPILPLIIDTEVAGRCQPERPRPPRYAWPGDAELQVSRALDAHAQSFGKRPIGMWPAEGAVSPEAAALMARQGVRWIATDEAQLWRSLPGEVERRADLYRPYRLKLEDQEINVVFRDRPLSDLIGFSYARNPAQVAVDDFMGRLHGIRDQMRGRDEPGLVVVALDGENPWEYYPDGGRPFLEKLYEALEKSTDIRTVGIGPHIEANAPRRTLTHIHSGSWINGDYGIWLGGEVENRAWRVLGETRRFFEAGAAKVDAETAERARTHLLQAEGSDWFWWFGDTFHSDNDAEFDHLFRAHLRRVYSLLGVDPPSVLSRSLYPPPVDREGRPPRAFVSPRFGDQDSTWLDWAGGGVYDLGAPRASMHRSAQYFGRLRYGFDLDRLYVRLEPPAEQRNLDLDGVTLRIRVHGHVDHEARVDLSAPAGSRLWRVAPDLQPCDPVPLPLVKVRQNVVEVGIPFSALGLAAGDAVRLTAHLLRDRVELDRYPPRHDIELTVPDAGFEDANWSV